MLLTLTLTPDAGFQLPEPIHLITSDAPDFLKWLCVYGLDKHQKEVLSSLRRQTNDTPDLSTQTGYTYRILGSIGHVIAAAISGPIVKVGIAQIELPAGVPVNACKHAMSQIGRHAATKLFCESAKQAVCKPATSKLF